ncbi:hypothetical protein KKC13_07305 [bacterium]|nr:hypothetical protein [bacterium]MBU1958415.1 hypothetical protein [bacterium]
MTKYISVIIVALFMHGCSGKTEVATPKVEAPMTKEADSIKKEVKTLQKDPVLPAGFVEKKVMKPMDSNVPQDCQEWSDGCNTCTRAENNQASCTVYTCDNKGAFSCLKWQ